MDLKLSVWAERARATLDKVSAALLDPYNKILQSANEHSLEEFRID